MARFRRNSNQSFQNTTDKRSLGQSGQIVVEYVLLLTVAVAIAAVITKTMVGTDKDNPGFILTAWKNIVVLIGADKADDIDRAN